ncbi:Natural cytotoxicity triggering receptor 2, partial [Plecturocebus cupreus]
MRVVGAEETGVVGAEETRVVGAEETRVVGAEETRVVGAEETGVVGAEETRVVGAEETGVVGAEETGVVGAEETRVVGAEEMCVVGAEEMGVVEIVVTAGSGSRWLCGQRPGSQAQSKAQVLHKEAGQTLTVRCQYPSTSRLYETKGWCKEASAFKCIRLVTSSKPRTLASISRFSIWDDPAAGFFTVITTDLREEDSGYYWCRIYHPSDNSVSKSVRFYLVVSP